MSCILCMHTCHALYVLHAVFAMICILLCTLLCILCMCTFMCILCIHKLLLFSIGVHILLYVYVLDPNKVAGLL
jgi:hypothetical protein